MSTREKLWIFGSLKMREPLSQSRVFTRSSTASTLLTSSDTRDLPAIGKSRDPLRRRASPPHETFSITVVHALLHPVGDAVGNSEGDSVGLHLK